MKQWTFDTLKISSTLEFTSLRLRGRDANHLFLMAHNGKDAGVLFRWDGTNWRDTTVGPADAVVADMLFLPDGRAYGAGFWSDGRSAIWDFTNEEDNMFALNPIGGRLTAIGGNDHVGIWAVGFGETCYRIANGYPEYSYYSPEKSRVPLLPTSYAGQFLGSDETGIFLTRYEPSSTVEGFTTYVSRFNGFQAILVGSFFNAPNPMTAFWPTVEGTLYYPSARGISELTSSGSRSVLRFDCDIRAFGGTGDDDLFAVGAPGGVQRIGSGWRPLEALTVRSATFFDVWASGNDIFVCGKIPADIHAISVARGSRPAWNRP